MALLAVPAGVVPDKNALYGLIGFMSNANNYAESIAPVTTAGTSVTLTVAQTLAGFTQLNSGASGGFTINLPATSAIIAALGPSIPTDGTFSMSVSMANNNVGQTGTLTAGDASTTVTGTATVATNTTRQFIMNVASPTTLTFTNVGSKGL